MKRKTISLKRKAIGESGRNEGKEKKENEENRRRKNE